MSYTSVSTNCSSIESEFNVLNLHTLTLKSIDTTKS